MTAAMFDAIEADVRLPVRRWRPQPLWPVVAGSILLHLIIAGVLYPGGGAPPEAPAPLYIVDVVLRAPGAPALPEGVNAGTPAAPQTASLATPTETATPAQAVPAVRPTGASRPLAPAASAPAASADAAVPAPVAAASPAAVAPSISGVTPLTAEKSRVTTALRPAAPATIAPDASASRAVPASAASAALPAIAAAPVVAAKTNATAPATAAPPTPADAQTIVEAVPVAEASTAAAAPSEAAPAPPVPAPRSFVAVSPAPSAARPAPPVGPPPSDTPGTAPRLEPDALRAFQTARPALPPPPLPPRKPPSLLARESNPRIVRENRRIVGAPIPIFDDPLSIGAPRRPTESAGGVESAPRRPQTRPRPPSTPIASTPAAYRDAAFWNPPPPYPIQAVRQRLEGVVLLRVAVSAGGAATSVAIRRSSGHRILDEAAVSAVKTWRFKPATRSGAPVAGEVDVPVPFRLSAAGVPAR